MLFHPACNQLVRRHMDDLAQKVPRPSKGLFHLCEADAGLKDSIHMCIIRRVPNNPISQSPKRDT